MKNIYLLIVAILGNVSLIHSQTNLICNPGFENVNENTRTHLQNAGAFYAGHFAFEEDNSLFTCWYTRLLNGDVSSTRDLAGIEYGIMPGFYATANGTGGGSLFMHTPNDPYADLSDPDEPKAFYPGGGAEGESRLNLQTLPNGLIGIDLSPPNSKFGENVNATEGTNYVALLDIRNEKNSGGPNLKTQLKYSVVKDVKYAFLIDYAKMNLLGYVASTDEWDHVVDGKLKIWLADDNTHKGQLICTIDIESNDWNTKFENVVANQSWTHLYLEFNPLEAFQILNTEKIAGIFIDNLKLYEDCETPDIQCVNSNYRRDLLDARLEQVQMESPLAYPDDEGNDDGKFKTVRAYHLENVKRLELKIYPQNSSTACYELDMWYPPSDWFWDGNNYNGDPMPDGRYDIVMNAVSNDCFHITNADEITSDGIGDGFPLKRHYSVFNVWTSTNIEDGNSFINGLENVQWMNVRLYTIGGSLVHEFNLNNPPSSLGLSIASLEAYGGVQNGTVAPASYRIVVTVSNNCSEITYDFSSVHIGTISDAGNISQFYNWSPVSKPSSFTCPFDFHYNQNVLSPMNCCEGYLHLENIEVWNSWGEVNIQDSILIGPNVVFEEGTYNYLNSGGQIVLLPDETGVVVHGEAIFKPNTFLCAICKNYTFESVSDEQAQAEAALERDLVALQRDSLAVTSNGEMIVFPNPASGEQELTLRAGREPIDPNRYRLALSNSMGAAIPIKILSASEKMIRFKGGSSLTSGAYYLSYESNGEQKTFSIIIK